MVSPCICCLSVCVATRLHCADCFQICSCTGTYYFLSKSAGKHHSHVNKAQPGWTASFLIRHAPGASTLMLSLAIVVTKSIMGAIFPLKYLGGILRLVSQSLRLASRSWLSDEQELSCHPSTLLPLHMRLALSSKTSCRRNPLPPSMPSPVQAPAL